MTLSTTEIAIILTPLLSVLAIIYTWLKTRVKEAKFLVFDFHITNIKMAEFEGEKIVLIISKFTILNTGDRTGFLKFNRAKLKGKFKETNEKQMFDIEQPDFRDPLSFSLDAGIATDRGFTFETKYLPLIIGWEKGTLTAEGTYITHKGKTKEFKFELIGSSEKNSFWQSPKKRKDKTIFHI